MMMALISFVLSSALLLLVSLDVKDSTAAVQVMRRMGILPDRASGLDLWLERLLPRSYTAQLQEDMERLGMQGTALSLIKKHLMNGLAVWTGGSFLGILTGNMLLPLTGLLFGLVVYQVPIQNVRQKARALSFAVDKELTYLMTNISQLILSGMAVYPAVIQAAEAVPEKDALKPYARQLVSDLRLGTDPGDAFVRLGIQLQNPHAQRFGVVLSQMHLASGELSMDILMKQYNIAEKAKEEMFKKAVKLLPNQLKWPNLVMFANFVLLPVLVLGYTIINILLTVF